MGRGGQLLRDTNAASARDRTLRGRGAGRSSHWAPWVLDASALQDSYPGVRQAPRFLTAALTDLRDGTAA